MSTTRKDEKLDIDDTEVVTLTKTVENRLFFLEK